MLKVLAPLAAAAALSWGGSAAAAIRVIDLTVDPGDWVQFAGTNMPFGLGPDPSLTAQVLLDDTILGPYRTISAPDGTFLLPTIGIVGLSFTAGTRTFTISDLAANSFAIMEADLSVPRWVRAALNGGTAVQWVKYGGSAELADAGDRAYCNYCVSYTQSIDGIVVSQGAKREPYRTSPIPEPATWAMMIVGFGLAGAGLRRSRPLQVGLLW